MPYERLGNSWCFAAQGATFLADVGKFFGSTEGRVNESLVQSWAWWVPYTLIIIPFLSNYDYH